MHNFSSYRWSADGGHSNLLVQFIHRSVHPASYPPIHPIIKLLFLFIQSPDGHYLACGAIDGIINIFDLTTGKLLHTLEGTVHCFCCLYIYPLLLYQELCKLYSTER